MSVVVEPWAQGNQPCFERLLRLARARREAAVCTAGRGNVELMIRLCREGYAKVECLRQATCGCADGGVDLLLIPGGTVAESVTSILSRTVRVLREGGVVALKLDDVDDDCAVQAALAGLGLEVASTVFDLSDGVLVAHTVRHASAALRAA